MSEQIEMRMQLNILRNLMRAPSKFSGKELKQNHAEAEGIADRCYFNCGWYAAQPDKALPGSASTQKIFADLRTITEAVLSKALPPKRTKAGRPPKEPKLDAPYPFVIAAFVAYQGSKTTLECIRMAINEGWLDKTTADTTHLRRIERFMDAARKRIASSNVIPFPTGRRPNRN
jgi:hypothetical protein